MYLQEKDAYPCPSASSQQTFNMAKVRKGEGGEIMGREEKDREQKIATFGPLVMGADSSHQSQLFKTWFRLIIFI